MQGARGICQNDIVLLIYIQERSCSHEALVVPMNSAFPWDESLVEFRLVTTTLWFNLAWACLTWHWLENSSGGPSYVLPKTTGKMPRNRLRHSRCCTQAEIPGPYTFDIEPYTVDTEVTPSISESLCNFDIEVRFVDIYAENFTLDIYVLLLMPKVIKQIQQCKNIRYQRCSILGTM